MSETLPWTLEADRELLESGRAIGRTAGSVKSRLAHLGDPTHPACIRWSLCTELRCETLPTRLQRLPLSFKRDLHDEPKANSSAATGSTLAAGQQQAIDEALKPGNTFITGGAGTGKSFVARLVAARLRETHRGEGEVALCALTGIAALTLGNGARLRARARARAIRVHNP